MEKITLIELDESYLPKMAELYKEAFAGEPWNDDWSDSKQLNEYIKDISKAYNALNYGLMIDGELAGMSVGRINHWWEGTNYNIDELCIAPQYQGQGIGSKFIELIEQRVREKGLAGIFLQTDNDKPSYHFYHKNGFNDLDMHISLYKSVRRNEEAKVSDAESESDGITLDTANLNDIPELIRLRIQYMIDDFGSVSDEEREGMEKQLPDYFERELGKKLVAFVARKDDRLVAAAYLHIIEMPANSILLNGIYGEVLSVYTEPEYRGKGLCTKLIQNLIDYGREAGLGRIDLSATSEGYPIYSKLGFKDKEKRYTDMRYNF